jgi:hypothetical protein
LGSEELELDDSFRYMRTCKDECDITLTLPGTQYAAT